MNNRLVIYAKYQILQRSLNDHVCTPNGISGNLDISKTDGNPKSIFQTLWFSWTWHNGTESNFRFFGTVNLRLAGSLTRKIFVHSYTMKARPWDYRTSPHHNMLKKGLLNNVPTFGCFTLGGKKGYINVSKSGLHHIPRHSPTLIK